MAVAATSEQGAAPADLGALAIARWPHAVSVSGAPGESWRLECRPEALVELCRWLAGEQAMTYGTLVVEEGPTEWLVRHVHYAGHAGATAQVLTRLPFEQHALPSISEAVHAADWHEREAEDLFGLSFEGHPRLGDFVLHEHWPEGVNPMRKAFDATAPDVRRESRPVWAPHRLVQAEGAFVMPVGPIYSDYAESALFLLETVGEDVLRTLPRLFYKYRGVEKIAEGRAAADALLLAERFSGTSAFAQALAYSRAVEQIAGAEVPPRARALRAYAAELERVRHHVAVIAALCGSTALAVAANQAALYQEELLRISCALSGHRYLFGLCCPGGLSIDLPDPAVRQATAAVVRVRDELRRLRRKLTRTSSFLDRLEEVGSIARLDAQAHGLVGPVARACGLGTDLRRALPYGHYRELPALRVPSEHEGDGYARLRLFADEVEVSVELLEGLADSLPPGPVHAPAAAAAGEALSWVEAPGGACLHWLRTDEQGRVLRWRPATPAFANWHGFHLAAERFAFQDFPIIMASMGLSIAESDR